jgi:hypothetical protein
MQAMEIGEPAQAQAVEAAQATQAMQSKMVARGERECDAVLAALDEFRRDVHALEGSAAVLRRVNEELEARVSDILRSVAAHAARSAAADKRAEVRDVASPPHRGNSAAPRTRTQTWSAERRTLTRPGASHACLISQELRRAADESKTGAAALVEQLSESQEKLAHSEREKTAALTSLAATRIALFHLDEFEARIQVSEATAAALTEQLADSEDRLSRALNEKDQALAALAAISTGARTLNAQQGQPASTAKPPAANALKKRRKPSSGARAATPSAGARAAAPASAAPVAESNRTHEPSGHAQVAKGASSRAAAVHSHSDLNSHRPFDEDSAESLSDSSLEFKRQVPKKTHKSVSR